MPRGALHSEASPRQALLADVDSHGSATVFVDCRPASEFGEHMIGTHVVPVVFGHPFGAPHATGFFVGDTEIDQVALWLEAFVGELAEHHRHR